MTDLTDNMRPPTNGVIRSKAIYDHGTLRVQTQNRSPFIAGATPNPKTNRVMRAEPLWSPRHGRGLGRNERALVMAEIPAFSVLNGIGQATWTKYTFFKNYAFIGLSTGTMESNAINTDADIRTAVDRQGLTFTKNNGPETIYANELVMIDVPSNTEHAERLATGRAPPEGGTPERRHTGFVLPWSVAKVSQDVVTDLSEHLRGRRLRGATDLPTTPEFADSVRELIIAGAILGYFWQSLGNQLPADGPQLQANIIGLPPGNPMLALIDQLSGGGADNLIAALLAPTDREFVVAGLRIPPGSTNSTVVMNRIQRTTVANILRRHEAILNEAGRDRIIGRAINTSKPDGVLHILLSG